MAAVASVIVNRVNSSRYPDSVVGVVLQEWQFSTWNPTDSNRLKILTVTDSDPLFAQALQIAGQAISGALPDTTYGSLHYHAAGVTPNWMDESKRVAIIGHHYFYAGIA